MFIDVDFFKINNDKVIDLLKKVVEFELMIESVVEYCVFYCLINYI